MAGAGLPALADLRATPEGLDVAAAAALLGVPVPPEAHDVVRRLLRGENVQVEDDGQPAATLALLAGLATPGRTAWLDLDAPPLPEPVPDGDVPPLPVSPEAGRGAVSTSIARPAEPEDAALVARLAAAEPEFAFLRRGQALDGEWGLLVVRGREAAGAPAIARGRPTLSLLSG